LESIFEINEYHRDGSITDSTFGRRVFVYTFISYLPNTDDRIPGREKSRAHL
jgi:hypothetical protein